MRTRGTTCRAVLALTAALGVLPVAASADIGPVPTDAACVSVSPTVSTTCPEPPQTQASSSAASASQRAAAKKQFSVSSTPALAGALVTAVNRARRPQGLRALRYSGQLASAASAHATALGTEGQFTHAWPTTGQLFGSWIRSFYPARGYRSWSAGENLLWASPGFTPASAVQNWLNSPVHRRVMLSPSWREIGIGVVSAVAAPGHYGERDVQIAAAEFGRRSR
jgi:uncharacterized protein YkwD